MVWASVRTAPFVSSSLLARVVVPQKAAPAAIASTIPTTPSPTPSFTIASTSKDNVDLVSITRKGGVQLVLHSHMC